MAYPTHTQTTSRSMLERTLEALSTWLHNLAERHAERRVMRETLRELSGLNGRDLADIGSSRAGMISKAYEASHRG